MSNLPQNSSLPDPPEDWLLENGFTIKSVARMKPGTREALRQAYQQDLVRDAARHADPFYDEQGPIDPPAPEDFVDPMPDYSELPPGVEPGTIQEAEYHRFMEHYYGYNQSPNPEIAA